MTRDLLALANAGDARAKALLEPPQPRACYRCHRLFNGFDSFNLYLRPGSHGRRQTEFRVPVHAVCIADEAADGSLVRVSLVSFEVADLNARHAAAVAADEDRA